jgi:hypothetical protein
MQPSVKTTIESAFQAFAAALNDAGVATSVVLLSVVDAEVGVFHAHTDCAPPGTRALAGLIHETLTLPGLSNLRPRSHHRGPGE